MTKNKTATYRIIIVVILAVLLSVSAVVQFTKLTSKDGRHNNVDSENKRKEIYAEFLQEHETVSGDAAETGDVYVIDQFSYMDLNNDHIFDLISQEVVDDGHERWHLNALGKDGEVEVFTFRDGSEAVFDNEESEDSVYVFYVCKYGHIHNCCYDSGAFSEEIYEAEGDIIVNSFSFRKENGNVPAVCRQNGSPISQELYELITAECESALILYRNTEEGRQLFLEKDFLAE